MSPRGFDLKGLTVGELGKLIGLAQAELVNKQEEEKERVRQQIEKLASDAGFSVDEVLGVRAVVKRRTRAKAQPKYENPLNKGDTWTGRGRKPKWVETALKGGKKLEDLLIKKAS